MQVYMYINSLTLSKEKDLNLPYGMRRTTSLG